MHGPLNVKYYSFIINLDEIFISFFLENICSSSGGTQISCYGLADVSDSASSQIGKNIFPRTEAKKGGRATPWLLGIPHNSN